MKFRRIIYSIIGALVIGGTVFSCRTSEANYRAAYERAVAGRDSALALENTVYGQDRRDFATQTVTMADGRSIGLVGRHVRVADNTGNLPEQMKRYNVVVGRFKQIFNARDMRNRLADGAFPSAMVLQTAEPYYYVVSGSYSTLEDAVAAMDAIGDRVSMRPPLPFIIDAAPTSSRRQGGTAQAR